MKNDLAYYDRQAAHWWEPDAKIRALEQLNPPRFEFFDRYITDWSNLKVLDVGCGGGYSCEFLAQRGAKVWGIDRSEPCIQVARDRVRTQGLPIEYQTGTAEALPYPDNSFDAITCLDVLEHVASPQQTIAEIARILKPGGWFCFDTVNRTRLSYFVMIFLLETLTGLIPRGIHDWQKFIRPRELQQWLGDRGLTTMAIAGFNPFGRPFIDYLPALWHYLRTQQLRVRIDHNTSVMYVGVAQKHCDR
ncbi:MAG: bifunctional 2-polyprenyl-6-hydroxyphenol methylase/3-demethylubiquinol 3-O-methyltransferase UbiG [Cyanobacteria bacterium J06641_5]